MGGIPIYAPETPSPCRGCTPPKTKPIPRIAAARPTHNTFFLNEEIVIMLTMPLYETLAEPILAMAWPTNAPARNVGNLRRFPF